MNFHSSSCWVTAVLAAFVLASAGCGGPPPVTPTPVPEETPTPVPWADVPVDAAAYWGSFLPLNAPAIGTAASGSVMLVVDGEELRIELQADRLPPDMMHLQHLHGFPEGGEARCPDIGGPEQVVDLIEASEIAGTTLIPFHDDPTSLEITTDTYPSADADGAMTYRQTVSWPDLQAAVEETYGIQDLDLSQLVVLIHGVPEELDLPEAAQSLPGVPAHVTLPIACATLDKVK